MPREGGHTVRRSVSTSQRLLWNAGSPPSRGMTMCGAISAPDDLAILLHEGIGGVIEQIEHLFSDGRHNFAPLAVTMIGQLVAAKI